MPAIALTDHGNLFGAVEFYKTAKAKGVKPLVGCEIYLVIDHLMTEKPRRLKPAEDEELETGANSSGLAGKIFHMGLLARNAKGWANLCKLVSLAHTQGMYYRPRVDFQTLARHAEGLTGFTGCMQGVIPQHLLRGEMDKAREWLSRFIDIFGKEHYFVEIQNHGIPEQSRINKDILKLAREFGVKVICSNDAHYTEQAHSVPHDMLLCIQTGKKVADQSRMRYANDQFYLKSRAEMATLFGEVEGALDNTLLVAEQCDLSIEFGKSKYPVFRMDAATQARCGTNPGFLRELCEKGMERRYGVAYAASKASDDPAVKELATRLDYELDIIGRTGFVDYFLIVQDFINWAKERNIPVGPGRGSGAGCMVAYVLGITDTDPIRFRLLFERMLNLERVSPPDFDIDFCMRRRDEVIEYVRSKYGADCVANIITFGTFGAKMVVRDIARVMDVPYGDADRIAKMVPEGPDVTIEKALAQSAELRAEVERNAVAKNIFEHGRVIEGMVRNTGKHAAGIIIADQPLIDLVPVTIQEEALTTQFEKGAVEDLGLLKMDFLGLKTLTVIADAVQNIHETVDPKFDLEKAPYDDQKTYDLLRETRTVGVFQMESGGMQSLCRQLEVGSIDEIIALIALYRPGPMDWIPDYVKGKKEPTAIKYPHPILKDLLKETYGVMVYQEQVMEAAKILAGYTLGGADILRRAMGKKDVKKMAEQQLKFIKGCKERHNISEDTAKDLFSILEKFAGYGFNKSHSAAYGILTYRTAYLKANFPAQFMAAALTCESGNSDNTAKFLDECQAMNITVAGPDINLSRTNFTPLVDPKSGESKILFGLASIKGVGASATEPIIKEREAHGPYKDFRDFVTRVDSKTANKRVLENLIKTGAFDSVGEDRGTLLADMDGIMAEAASAQKDREAGQGSLFDLLAPEPPKRSAAKAAADKKPVNTEKSLPLAERLQFEKELLGFYVSGHPLNAFKGITDVIDTFAGEAYRELPDRTPFRLCGVVSKLDKKISKKDNRPWAIVTLSSKDSNHTFNIYSDAFERSQHLLATGTAIVVQGSISHRNDDILLNVESVLRLDQAISSLVRKATWYLEPGILADEFMQLLKARIDAETGATNLRLGFVIDGQSAAIADVAQPLRWMCTAEDYQALRRHPAVQYVELEVPPPQPREREWRRGKSS